MKIIAKLLFLMSLVLLIQVCTTQPEKKAQKSVFEQFTVDFNANEVLAEEKSMLQFATGTQLKIPANAFVDAQGNAVKGKVKIDFREFHNAAEIMVSGITMVYDSAGKSYNFESAGMFDIRGSQAGKPVFLAQGKGIQVDLASYVSGSYNFYYLQENKEKLTLNSPFLSKAYAQDFAPGQKWQLISTSNAPQANLNRQAKLDSLNKLLPNLPQAPQAYDEKAPTFDLDIDTKEFPELQAFEGIIWQYTGSIDPSIANQNDWVFKTEWTNIQLKKIDDSALEYELILSNVSQKFATKVRPALRGEAFAQAQKVFQEKMKQYEATQQAENEKVAQIKAQKEIVESTGKYIRAFNVINFGIFNCDIPIPDNDMTIVNANFKIDGNADLLKQAKVYLVAGRNLIEYRESRFTNLFKHFKFRSEITNRIIAILPGDKIAVFGKEDFKKIPLKNSIEAYTFNLRMIEKPLKSVNELYQLMQDI